jgi:hypothetical protein
LDRYSQLSCYEKICNIIVSNVHQLIVNANWTRLEMWWDLFLDLYHMHCKKFEFKFCLHETRELNVAVQRVDVPLNLNIQTCTFKKMKSTLNKIQCPYLQNSYSMWMLPYYHLQSLIPTRIRSSYWMLRGTQQKIFNCQLIAGQWELFLIKFIEIMKKRMVICHLAFLPSLMLILFQIATSWGRSIVDRNYIAILPWMSIWTSSQR